MSLLLIFGAGASFDSVPKRFWGVNHRPNQPPLTAELADARFAPMIRGLPYCNELVAEIRSELLAGRGVEELLETLASDPVADRTVAQLIAFRYYLRNVIATCSNKWSDASDGATNFAGLVSRLERWRAANQRIECVTFNYDRLLEEALTRAVERTFLDIDDFAFGQKYGVFKLHGSVDWFRLVRHPRELSEADLIKIGPKLKISAQVVTEHVYARNESLSAAVPALAVPTLTKANFECPPEHVQLLQQQLPKIDRVLVVGWAGREQTFTQLMGDLLPDGAEGRVVDVNLPAADAVAAILQAAAPQAHFLGADVDGFSGLLGSTVLDELLA